MLRGQELAILWGRHGRFLPPHEKAGLNAEQLELLRHLARENDTFKIADAMNLSPMRVNTMLRAIVRLMGAASRKEAVAVARRQGLL